jgi:hypothetical protein
MTDTVQLRLILPSHAAATRVETALAAHGRTEREPAQTLDLGTIVILASLGLSLAQIGALQAQAEATRAQVEATRAQVELTQAQVAATQAQAETSRVAALKTMLDIQRELQAQGQAAQARIGAPGGPMRSFAEADEAFLRGLLGLGSG